MGPIQKKRTFEDARKSEYHLESRAHKGVPGEAKVEESISKEVRIASPGTPSPEVQICMYELAYREMEYQTF